MSIWQSKEWKELLLKSNQAIDVFKIDWILIEKRSLWLWQFWLFILWIENLWQITKQNKFINLCKQQNCIFIQIETFSISNKNSPIIEKMCWKLGYYKKFITPYTAIIDLSKTVDEILSEMKPKWRYNINLSLKKWIEVFEAEISEKNIKIFYDLMTQTTVRDKFSWNTIDYYKNFLQIISNSKLIFTKIWEKILSAWIFVFDKEISIYYYWASTSEKEFRNLMAPYLMQWYAIQKAKDFWSKYYDFLWIASPGDKNSSLAWVSDFKLKFTQNIVNCSESYIWINNNFKYNLLKICKKIKSKIR